MSHQMLGYILDERHKNSGLSHRNLKGQDYLAVTQFEKACREAGFYVWQIWKEMSKALVIWKSQASEMPTS
jgi:hypothetical protein